MKPKTKKNIYEKMEFSDEEVYDQIKDDIQEIKDKCLKVLEEQQLINNLYEQKKKQKRKRKIMQKDINAKSKISYNKVSAHYSSDDEQGQINDQNDSKNEMQQNDPYTEGVPSISNLGDHIRPLTLTRNRIVDLINSRRFEELVKGCFVRYLIDSNPNTNSNSYIIAQIVGVTEGSKEYFVNNIKTKILLKLQETSQNVVTLSLQLISNQHPPGGLQIQKWLQTNRNKIPKERELKEKLEEHTKLLVEQLSSVEIDTNIWKKAKRIAEICEQPKEDITHLIDFAGDKLHNIDIQIQDFQIGRKQSVGDIKGLQKDKKQVSEVLETLKILGEKYSRSRVEEKKLEKTTRQKKYSWNFVEEKRKDTINEKMKSKYFMVTSFQGYNRLKSQVLQSHAEFEINCD